VGASYLLRRLGGAVLTILAVVVLNFFLFRLVPGDPVNSLLPRNVSQEQKAALRERLGLDLPIAPGIVRTPSGFEIAPETLPDSLLQNQFVVSFGNLLQLDFGDSFAESRPVVDVISGAFWPTILLVGSATSLAIVAGVFIGIVAGWRRGSRFDVISTNAALVLYAVPLFWLSMLLLWVFATPHGIPLFPSQQMVTPGASYANGLEHALDIGAHLVLPTITLALALIAAYSLIMRSSMVETLREDYITTARAKGLTERQVVRRHAIRNAMLPTVSIIALSFGLLLTGAVAVEEVYAWPGLGALTVDAIRDKDFPLLQGLFLVITVCVVFANLVADLLYGILDPRVRT
jgi:peptide/nickel transport system permease protein